MKFTQVKQEALDKLSIPRPKKEASLDLVTLCEHLVKEFENGYTGELGKIVNRIKKELNDRTVPQTATS